MKYLVFVFRFILNKVRYLGCKCNDFGGNTSKTNDELQF